MTFREIRGSILCSALATGALLLTFAGCAAVAPAERAGALFADRDFAPPTVRIGADDVFAMSPAMERYIAEDIAAELRLEGRKQGLINALYMKGQLRLEYDSGTTRNAAEAFDARSGNCLSLVIMSAAFAKRLGLPVRYQLVLTDEVRSRSGDLYLAIGHVNLVVGSVRSDVVFGKDDRAVTTIDFWQPDDVANLPVQPISEETVIAMYLNNRAVESLADGQIDNAYWWARASIEADARFLNAYNTLGAIYSRHGNWTEAATVLRATLARAPDNTEVLSNLIVVDDKLGLVAESRSLTDRLHRIEPHAPFADFNAGMKAMRAGDFLQARDAFAREVARDPYYHEFHYWLGLAYLRLGALDAAREQLAIAKDDSTTRRDYDLYAAKLERLSALQFPH